MVRRDCPSYIASATAAESAAPIVNRTDSSVESKGFKYKSRDVEIRLARDKAVSITRVLLLPAALDIQW